MASYNSADLIGETIRSVLRQSCGDFELIVADDCSTDNTAAVVRRFADPRIRLLHTPHNLGPVGARNLACAHAEGDCIAALDQDDLCHPDRFGRQLAYLAANPAPSPSAPRPRGSPAPACALTRRLPVRPPSCCAGCCIPATRWSGPR